MDRQIAEEVRRLEQDLLERKKKIRELRCQLRGEPVQEYIFLDAEGKEVSLSSLFNGKDELIIVHNMGRSCPYCTMWADGFNGIYRYIVQKAGFALTTPDEPPVMAKFAAERGWKFPVLSTCANSFKGDFGFERSGTYHPGVSVFTKDEQGNLCHYTKTDLGPRDEYCVVWSLFDLLPSGSEDYQPR